MVSFDLGIDEAHEGRQTQAACGGILIAPPEDVDVQCCWSFLTAKTRAALRSTTLKGLVVFLPGDSVAAWIDECILGLSRGSRRWILKAKEHIVSVNGVKVCARWCHKYRKIVPSGHHPVIFFKITPSNTGLRQSRQGFSPRHWIFYIYIF